MKKIGRQFTHHQHALPVFSRGSTSGDPILVNVCKRSFLGWKPDVSSGREVCKRETERGRREVLAIRKKKRGEEGWIIGTGVEAGDR